MTNPPNAIIFVIIIIFCIYKYIQNRRIYIFIGNSFYNYYTLPKLPIKCIYNRIIYNCHFTDKRNIKHLASIYNGNRKFPKIPNTTYNIIMTTEKLSQVQFMKNVGEGKNKYYHAAVDYRSYNNKWHIEIPLYQNIHKFLYLSNTAFGNISSFMMRNNSIVYIQKVGYKNRQYIVKEKKVELIKKYKFCLGIENSVILWKKGTKYEATEINNDYITEKLIDCLIAGSIPIYFGPKNVNDFLPHPDSIINLSNFKSIENVTSYIRSINNNISLLIKHISWHNNYSKKWFKKYKKKTNVYCRICNHVKKYS